MNRKYIMFAVGGIAALVAILWLVDAAVITDEERIEELVDVLAGPVDGQTIERVLEWTNPDVQPLEISAYGVTQLYRDADELEERARSGTRRYTGQTVRVLSSGITIEGDVAQVSFRLMTDSGFVEGELTLKKHGENWWVSRAYLH